MTRRWRTARSARWRDSVDERRWAARSGEHSSAYDELDPGNARLRALAADMVESEAWRLLWMPPSLPYYAPGPPFATARAARRSRSARVLRVGGRPAGSRGAPQLRGRARMMRERDRRAANTPEARAKLRPLLRFAERKAERRA